MRVFSVFALAVVGAFGCSAAANGPQPGDNPGSTSPAPNSGAGTPSNPQNPGNPAPPSGGAETADGGAGSSAGDGGTTPDGGGEAAPGGFAAPHPALPQVVKGAGGVLTAPKFVAITFPNDALQQSIEQFANTVGATDYWRAIASEYGIGAGAGGTHVHIATPAPSTIDDAQIQAFVKQGIGTTLGAFDPQAIYTFFYPDTTTITQAGAASCSTFDGYHGDVALGNGQFAVYAVVARCGGGGNAIDSITSTGSHELIEAATDPSEPGTYQAVADADYAWEAASGGSEVGDLCQNDDDSVFKPAGFDFLVQRTWSNAAALLGANPCVPAAVPASYFNSAPVLPDMLSLTTPNLGAITVKGVRIAAGQSRTIELDLFSDAPTADWQLTALDMAAITRTGTSDLQFAFDKTSGKNGDKVMLTITVVNASAAGSPFVIQSKLGAKTNTFAGIVGQ